MRRGGKDGGAFASATDRDAGRTLEGSGRVSGGQDEGDCGVGEWGEQLERVG